MTESFSTLRVNANRMHDSFIHLALIGATGDGGVSRVTFSEAHLAARNWLRTEIENSGLEFHMDGAGNHSALLACNNKNAPTILLGSHLDSVPNGGRFDGALGVVAALEVLRTVKENRIKLGVKLEAIDFTDEEGTLVGLLGSAALAGRLHPEALKNPRGGREDLIAGMNRAGLSEAGIFKAARSKGSLAGYLELHIEQGKRLERAGFNIGVVTAIVGIRSYRLSFIGRADHAGSTLMEDRLDAGLGASAFTLAAREIVMRDFPNCVVNIGKMDFAPGVFNIVPLRVDVSLEFRSPDADQFAELDGALIECAKLEAERFRLDLRIEFLGGHAPSAMSENMQQAFMNSCDTLGLTHMSLVSGAIHDAQSLNGICPIGMIFVPSVDGASHAPRELTKWEDCVNGANILLQIALTLGSG